jgi:hypothetical protein
LIDTLARTGRHHRPLPALRTYVRKLDRSVTDRNAIVDAQGGAKAFPAYDRSGPVVVGWWQDDLAAQALMVSLLVVVHQVLAVCGASMAIAEKNELAK